MTDLDMIPLDDTTKPDPAVVDLMRAQIKRQLQRVNETDLLRALHTIRPERASEDVA